MSMLTTATSSNGSPAALGAFLKSNEMKCAQTGQTTFLDASEKRGLSPV
jgi:hypothetical protein